MKITKSRLKHLIKEEIKAMAESAIDDPIAKSSPEAQEYLKKLEDILKRYKGNIPKNDYGDARMKPGEGSSFTKEDGIPENNLFYTLNGSPARERIKKHIDETIAEMTALLRLFPSFISRNDLKYTIKTNLQRNIQELEKAKDEMTFDV